MPSATCRPLSPSSPDSDGITQESTGRELEQNLSVSRLKCLPLALADDDQIRDSGSAIFANIQNLVITGGSFVVSLSCRLYKQLIIYISYLPEQ